MWQRNKLHSKPCWAETAHSFPFLFHIYFNCSGPFFYNFCLENIHYPSIHGPIQPGPTQAHTWCFTKACPASLCQHPYSPSQHHHHHAWTFMATWIPKATLQHLKKSPLQDGMKQHGREAEFRNTEGKDTAGAELLLVPPTADRNIPICVNTALVNRATNPYRDKCHPLTSVLQQPNQSTAFSYF